MLELLSVQAQYGRIPVLHGVDLKVAAGSVFALFGPNGAGKSTILKVAGGRLLPSAGEVRLEGTPLGLTRVDALARRGVCSVPEGRGVFPNLAVHENLRMWTYCGEVDGAEVEQRAYDTFPVLKRRRRQLAGTLSGGEQQMLAVARVLVGRPRLLLLDEISMGLAPVVVDQLYEVITALAAEGVTIVLAEQFVHAAQAIATHAAIVLQGRVHRVGQPAEIAALAASAYLSRERLWVCDPTGKPMSSAG